MESLSWNLSDGFQLDLLNCGLLSDIPGTLNRTSLEKLLKIVYKCSIYPGNPDQCYIEMVASCSRTNKLILQR